MICRVDPTAFRAHKDVAGCFFQNVHRGTAAKTVGARWFAVMMSECHAVDVFFQFRYNQTVGGGCKQDSVASDIKISNPLSDAVFRVVGRSVEDGMGFQGVFAIADASAQSAGPQTTKSVFYEAVNIG